MCDAQSDAHPFNDLHFNDLHGQLHQFSDPITSKLPVIIIQHCHQITFTVATELH
jgi:hypothetical protein